MSTLTKQEECNALVAPYENAYAYLLDSKNRVVQVRKRFGQKYLIQYGYLFGFPKPNKRFEWVSKQEFETIPNDLTWMWIPQGK